MISITASKKAYGKRYVAWLVANSSISSKDYVLHPRVPKSYLQVQIKSNIIVLYGLRAYIAVTQHITAYCSMQVVDITLAE
jgi:hypothetical protein